MRRFALLLALVAGITSPVSVAAATQNPEAFPVYEYLATLSTTPWFTLHEVMIHSVVTELATGGSNDALVETHRTLVGAASDPNDSYRMTVVSSAYGSTSIAFTYHAPQTPTAREVQLFVLLEDGALKGSSTGQGYVLRVSRRLMKTISSS